MAGFTFILSITMMATIANASPTTGLNTRGNQQLLMTNRFWSPFLLNPLDQRNTNSKDDISFRTGQQKEDLGMDSKAQQQICQLPPQWTVNGGENLMNKAKGNVTVVALLAASCPFCIRQAFLLTALKETLEVNGITANYMIINEDSPRSRMLAWKLASAARGVIPVYQEKRASEPVWTELGGQKDDFYIYDRCGRLTFHIPLPFSKLTSPDQFVKHAIIHTYKNRVCGDCNPEPLPQEPVSKVVPVTQNLITQTKMTDYDDFEVKKPVKPALDDQEDEDTPVLGGLNSLDRDGEQDSSSGEGFKLASRLDGNQGLVDATITNQDQTSQVKEDLPETKTTDPAERKESDRDEEPNATVLPVKELLLAVTEAIPVQQKDELSSEIDFGSNTDQQRKIMPLPQIIITPPEEEVGDVIKAAVNPEAPGDELKRDEKPREPLNFDMDKIREMQELNHRRRPYVDFPRRHNPHYMGWFPKDLFHEGKEEKIKQRVNNRQYLEVGEPHHHGHDWDRRTMMWGDAWPWFAYPKANPFNRGEPFDNPTPWFLSNKYKGMRSQGKEKQVTKPVQGGVNGKGEPLPAIPPFPAEESSDISLTTSPPTIPPPTKSSGSVDIPVSPLFETTTTSSPPSSTEIQVQLELFPAVETETSAKTYSKKDSHIYQKTFPGRWYKPSQHFGGYGNTRRPNSKWISSESSEDEQEVALGKRQRTYPRKFGKMGEHHIHTKHHTWEKSQM